MPFYIARIEPTSQARSSQVQNEPISPVVVDMLCCRKPQRTVASEKCQARAPAKRVSTDWSDRADGGSRRRLVQLQQMAA